MPDKNPEVEIVFRKLEELKATNGKAHDIAALADKTAPIQVLAQAVTVMNADPKATYTTSC